MKQLPATSRGKQKYVDQRLPVEDRLLGETAPQSNDYQ